MAVTYHPPGHSGNYIRPADGAHNGASGGSQQPKMIYDTTVRHEWVTYRIPKDADISSQSQEYREVTGVRFEPFAEPGRNYAHDGNTSGILDSLDTAHTYLDNISFGQPTREDDDMDELEEMERLELEEQQSWYIADDMRFVAPEDCDTDPEDDFSSATASEGEELVVRLSSWDPHNKDDAAATSQTSRTSAGPIPWASLGLNAALFGHGVQNAATSIEQDGSLTGISHQATGEQTRPHEDSASISDSTSVASPDFDTLEDVPDEPVGPPPYDSSKPMKIRVSYDPDIVLTIEASNGRSLLSFRYADGTVETMDQANSYLYLIFRDIVVYHSNIELEADNVSPQLTVDIDWFRRLANKGLQESSPPIEWYGDEQEKCAGHPDRIAAEHVQFLYYDLPPIIAHYLFRQPLCPVDLHAEGGELVADVVRRADERNLSISQFIKHCYLESKLRIAEECSNWTERYPNIPYQVPSSTFNAKDEAAFVDEWKQEDHVAVPRGWDHYGQDDPDNRSGKFDLQQMQWHERVGLTEGEARWERDNSYTPQDNVGGIEAVAVGAVFHESHRTNLH